MIFFLILGLLLGAFAVIFALQNIAAITVTFFAWQLHGSLALILMLAVAAGVLITILVTIPEFISTSIKFRRLKIQNKKLEADIAALAEKNKTIQTAQATEIHNAEVERIGNTQPGSQV